MLDLIPMAKEYHDEEGCIASSKIAQFSEGRIQSAYPVSDDSRHEQGRVAHNDLLKR
jgi:hypothetical protein